jgi:DNA-binding PadR family transcriptional regulator
MRKWFVPLTVLGVGGIGAFLLTDKGRETLRRWRARFDEAPERWVEWNENAQLELDRIRTTLNQIAESLGPRSEIGR